MAKRTRKTPDAAEAPPAAPTPVPPAEATVPPTPDPPAETALPPQPPATTRDPVTVVSIALGEGNDGPKVWLLRSHKYHQMRIRFDEKPAEAVRQRLNAEGWKWRGEEHVWTKQLDRDARWRTQADAERLVHELANAVRADRGLPPTADLGRG